MKASSIYLGHLVSHIQEKDEYRYESMGIKIYQKTDVSLKIGKIEAQAYYDCLDRTNYFINEAGIYLTPSFKKRERPEILIAEDFMNLKAIVDHYKGNVRLPANYLYAISNLNLALQKNKDLTVAETSDLINDAFSLYERLLREDNNERGKSR